MVALAGISLPLAGCTDETAGNGDEDDDDDVNGDDETTDTGEESENGAEESENGDEDDETEDVPEESDPQEFAGTGDEVFEDLSLEDGLTVVEATHSGTAEFEVRLVPDDGDGMLLADATGDYDGRTAEHVEDDTYLLSVVGHGEWEVTITQPRDTSGDSLPQSISGNGNEVYGPFEFEGPHTASGDYDGEEISVEIFSPTDEKEFVFYHGNIDDGSDFYHDGIGYVEVESDGDWSIDLE